MMARDSQTMAYNQAAGHILSFQEALTLVQDHGNSESELVEELGRRITYPKQELLCWLGY